MDPEVIAANIVVSSTSDFLGDSNEQDRCHLTVRSPSQFGLVLGLTFSDLEFCGIGEVDEPGVLRTSCVEDGVVCVMGLALPSSPPPPALDSRRAPQPGWAGFLFKTQVCFPLLLLVCTPGSSAI